MLNRNYKYFMWNYVQSKNYLTNILHHMFVLTSLLTALLFVGGTKAQQPTMTAKC